MCNFKPWLHSFVFTGVLVIVMAVTGCSQSTPPVASTTPTMIATLTPTSLPTPTPPDTPTPTAIPATLTPTPDLTATAAACKPVAQVTDAAVKQGSSLKSGAVFTQTWRFTNAGNCAWEKDTVLAFQSGEKFGAPDSIPVGTVDMGKTVEVSLTLKAPQRAGAYIGEWALRRPAGQVLITTTVGISVIVPTSTLSVAAVAPTVKPKAATPRGSIPPVGSGPFSVDANASGPWNCIGIIPERQWQLEWVGDFYIAVRGGPGNYTISDPDHCHWDFTEQKFVCRYGAEMNQSVMRTLYVSCPGCAQQQVVVGGRGVSSGDEGAGICRVRNFVAATPAPGTVKPTPAAPPGQPVAPLYPKSPIRPWNREEFIKALIASKDAVAAFRADFVEIAAGKMGDCSIYFWKFYSQWELQPGFTDVPVNWYPLYYQYRQALDNVRTATWPISEICLRRGGTIPEETDRLILATTQASIDSLGRLYAQAQTMK